jgi:non-specific serine/threonine protein kinase/serine/threonine-protein kinase
LSVLRNPAREDAPGDEHPAAVSPAKLSKRLRGDLDNIILMALRKEPHRRYAAVEQFSTDLKRHLENLPVIASRDTVRYRMTKFIRRHKAGVAAAAAVMATLLAGMAVTIHEARVARVQERRAEQRFNEVRELANSLLFDVHDSIQDLPGSTPARKMLVERALRYLDGLSRDAASDSSLQRELATAYEKVGTVQGNPFGANLGDTQGAFESYQKALSIRETIASANPENAADQMALARGRRMLATMTSNRVGSQSADIMAGELEALATAERAYQLAPSNPQVLEELQSNYDFLVTLRHYAGDYQGAWDYLQKERPIVEARLHAAPADRSLQIAMGKLEVKSGDELSKLGSRKEGQEHARRGVRLFQSLSAQGTDTVSKRYLAYAFDRLGDSLLMDGDTQHALEVYREGSKLQTSLLASDPNNALVQVDFGTETAKIGNALAISGRTKDGLEMLERAKKMFEAQLKRDPSYTEPMWSLAWTLLWEADVLGRTGNPAEALKNYHTVLSVWEHQDRDILAAIVAGIRVRMGTVLAKSGKPDQAVQEYQSALSAAQRVITQSPFVLEAQYAAAQSYSGLGKLFRTRAEKLNRSTQEGVKDWTEARTWYQRSAGAWQKIHNPGATTPAGFTRDRSEKVEDQLSDCDAALAKVTAIPPS